MTRSASLIRLSATASVLALAAGLAAPQAEAQSVGTAGAVNPSTSATRGGATRNLNLGSEVVFRERVTTSASGSVQVTFIDKSTLNVGPNSQILIDEFVYNPNTGVGGAAMTLSRGAMRFVGGAVSKAGNVEVRTPTATIGIRGGVAVISHTPDQGTRVVNVFGRTTITSAAGTQVITRPGFAATVQSASAPPTAPVRVAQADLDAANSQTTSRTGQTGGLGQPVSDQRATSGLAQTNAGVTPAGVTPVQSNNASRQQAQTAVDAATPGTGVSTVERAGQQNPVSTTSQATVATTQAATAVAAAEAAVQARLAQPRAFALALAPDPSSGTTIPFLLGSFAVSGNAVITPVKGYRVGGTGVAGDRTQFMQAALVINGQGIAQSSTISTVNGAFAFNQLQADRNNPQYTFTGGLTAFSRRAANFAPARATGSVTSVPGTVQLDADQLPTSFNATPDEYVRADGSVRPDTARQTGGGVTAQDYFFNVAATATPIPAGLGDARASQTLFGFMGGILRTQNWTTVADFDGAGVTSNFPGAPYRVSSNNLTVRFEADRSLAQGDASLTVQDQGQTTLRGVQVRLGRNPNDAAAGTRSAYVDNDTWMLRGRTETIPGTNDQRDLTTITTTNVTDARVYTGNRQLLIPWSVFEKQDPTGSRAFFPTVTQWGSYQHTQWGFWSGQLDNVTASGGVDRHAGQLNTWMAGVPTDPSAIPTVGSASFAGHAIATIRNFTGGTNYVYVAGGNFNGAVNFGSNTSTFSVSNLDGRNFSGSGTLNRGFNLTSGTLTGTGGLTGSYQGKLYGPGATETGGQFGFTGTNYAGSGIFIGRR